MGGYAGTILRINLTAGKISKEPLNMELARKYLGGRGLAGKMLFDEVAADVYPLAPENKIYIATGALTGTNAPSSGRFVVVTKSPLNGFVSFSNTGGFWGVQLKAAGYDMVVLEGKAANPVYISINNDLVEIKDASQLWGKDVYTTIEVLKQDFRDDKAKVLTIGPAGENLSSMAVFMNDLNRVAGRSGVGAVMGSKNLKAIIVRGTGKVANANPDKMKNVLRTALGKFKKNNLIGQVLEEYDAALVGGESISANDSIKKDACYRCPIDCGHKKKEDDKEKSPKRKQKSSFSSDCKIKDYEAIQAANDLCNKLGLDSMSVGCTIATGMELFQRGHIKPAEVDGTPLEFGNANGLFEWIRRIAYAEGLGAKMARGSYSFAETYGHPELSMTIKKLEVPAYDRKGIKGQSLEYATGNRGGGHVREFDVTPQVLGFPKLIDRDSNEGNAMWVKFLQDLTAVIDSIGMCSYTSAALGLPDYTAIVNAVTGFNYTDNELLACGERIWNIERLNNLKNGMTTVNDTLPESLLEIPSGHSKEGIYRGAELLLAYYTVREWDELGVPTPDCLKKLGIRI